MTAPFWDELRRSTQARIGLGRSGNGLPTAAELDLRSAHAEARDAVHDPLDVAVLEAEVTAAGLPRPVRATSRARTRDEYLRRPDLGRVLAEPLPSLPHDDGLVVVLADGLSARAVHAHAVGFLTAFTALRPEPVSTLVIATGARVALGDPIGAAAGAQAVLVLIGERPGLSVTDSLGAYLTYAPRPGRTDAERNCVSNIHPPDGLAYDRAARAVAGLLAAAVSAGESGVRIKDRTSLTSDPAVSREIG